MVGHTGDLKKRKEGCWFETFTAVNLIDRKKIIVYCGPVSRMPVENTADL